MNLWAFIHTKLKQNQKVFLMIVVDHKGSSPGRQGFKMAISEDTNMYGSIGGGVMEYKLVELCKNLLQKKDFQPFIKRQIHKGEVVDGSGMICSGEQTVLFYPLKRENIDLIKTIKASYTSNNSGLFTITQTALHFAELEQRSTKYNYTYKNKLDWSYQELLNKQDILYIIGGGHVSLAVSKLMRQLDFYIIVFDNRTHLNTFDKNNFAHKKQIIEYKTISDYIPESNFTFVAVMTNKYTDDKLILSKLIKNTYKYIGVLGSKAKLKLMFKVLEKEGFSKTLLNKVHAPIGLNIPSQTPDEIAISIAAEIITLRNKV